MGYHKIKDVIQWDYLNGARPKYDSDVGTRFLYLDENQEIQEHIVKTVGDFEVPLIDADDWFRSYYGWQSKKMNECAEKLLTVAIEKSPHQLTSRGMIKAIEYANDQLQLIDPEAPVGNLLFCGVKKLHKQFQEEFEAIKKEGQKSMYERTVQYSYEFNRRMIELKDLPENTLCVVPSNHFLGVIPIRTNKPGEYKGFGMCVIPELIYVFKLEPK